MIEIIREEEWDKTKERENENQRALPKDIRQMGKSDIGDRIYVEDHVYQLLHRYDDLPEKVAYVLLGRFENYYGKQCVFVEAAIRLEEISFEGELPVWNDGTWAYIYKKLCKAYDNMVIVGWAMDIKGQLPNMTQRIERLHNANFGGTHQVLLLLDSLEREEAFYCNAGGHMHRREGYYVYYDKSTQREQEHQKPQEPEKCAELPCDMEEKPQVPTAVAEQPKDRWNIFESVEDVEKQAPDRSAGKEPENVEARTEEQNTEKNVWEPRTVLHDRSARQEGNYRRQILKKEEQKAVFPTHTVSVVLALIACVLGFNAYQNYKKIDALEKTLTQLNTVQTASVAESSEGAVKIEDVAGTVEKQEVATETADRQSVPGTEQGAAEAEEQNSEKTEIKEQASAEESADKSVNAEQTDTEKTSEEKTDVGETADDSAGTKQEEAGQASAEQSAAAEEQQATETMTESERYLAQGYYVVQKGDNLAGICRKVYQSTAMMDKLCEVNDIDDPDAIYAGQYLTLPN